MLVYEATKQATDSSRYYRSIVKRVPDGLLNLLLWAAMVCLVVRSFVHER